MLSVCWGNYQGDYHREGNFHNHYTRKGLVSVRVLFVIDTTNVVERVHAEVEQI